MSTDTNGSQAAAPSLEVWGGVECTLNRVGLRFFDQVDRSGHGERLEDLDRFADLGLRALRFPILWERTWPEAAGTPRWDWSDARLARLRARGLRPIAGLVHHGSGPADTHVLDPNWSLRLATFAAAAAERYPWIRDWSPVNEPLTTARFSALYGHWYPHSRKPLDFARAFLAQVRGVVAAMRAIRRVVPEARLLQTEDLAKTHATRHLTYQADFENERRWLTFDVLCGRVDSRHPLWGYLRWLGVEEAELTPFLEQPCPPDVLGLNHYVTSERFLDERLERYPVELHGGNGRDAYADVEAVRVLAEGADGPAALLREAWDRYHTPMAVTEAHLGCTREEQLRWFMEVWDAAEQVRGEGADIRAVTAWSLLGAFDWASLATSEEGRYESGAFDVRSAPPRPTAVAEMLRRLADSGRFEHPVLHEVGWWRRPARLSFPPVHVSGSRPAALRSRPRAGCGEPHPVVVIGTGDLAGVLLERCEARGLAHARLDQGTDAATDAADDGELLAFLRGRGAWAVVHALDERGPATAEAAGHGRSWSEEANGLGRTCRAAGVRLVAFSSSHVFGECRDPRRECDEPAPTDELGRAIAAGERNLRRALPSALVLRTGVRFGGQTRDPLSSALRALLRGRPVAAPSNLTPSWSFLPHVADAALDLLLDGESGVWHLTAQTPWTPSEMLRRAAELAGVPASGVQERPGWATGGHGWWGRSVTLASLHGCVLPDLDEALQRWARERGPFTAVRQVVQRSRPA